MHDETWLDYAMSDRENDRLQKSQSYCLIVKLFIFLSISISKESSMIKKACYELVRTAPKGRWNGIERNYRSDEVHRLRSEVQIEYTLAVSILLKFRQ